MVGNIFLQPDGLILVCVGELAEKDFNYAKKLFPSPRFEVVTSIDQQSEELKLIKNHSMLHTEAIKFLRKLSRASNAELNIDQIITECWQAIGWNAKDEKFDEASKARQKLKNFVKKFYSQITGENLFLLLVAILACQKGEGNESPMSWLLPGDFEKLTGVSTSNFPYHFLNLVINNQSFVIRACSERVSPLINSKTFSFLCASPRIEKTVAIAEVFLARGGLA